MSKLYFATDDALAVVTVGEGDPGLDLQLVGNSIGCVAVDPLAPELVYCGTFGAGLWRSEDSGANWRRVERGIGHSKVQSVAVSRVERVQGRGVVYAGTEPSAVFRSEDGGDTWQECGGLTKLRSSNEWSFPPRPETHHVRWIEPDRHEVGRLFVAIEAGALVRSPDAGVTWRDRTADGPRDTHQLWIHAAAPGRLYSAAGDGYFESRDGGESWEKFEKGLRHRYVWSIAVDAADPDTIILSSADTPRHSHYQPAESHLYRRAGGSDWREIRDGLPEPGGRHTAVLGAHPDKAGTFFAAWENDVFRSTDGGVSWHPLGLHWPAECAINEICELAIAGA
jgi:hypothetical protein